MTALPISLPAPCQNQVESPRFSMENSIVILFCSFLAFDSKPLPREW